MTQTSRPFKIFEGLGWLMLGVLICFLAYRTGLGTFLQPGAGFMAFASGLFVAFVGILICISNLGAFSADQAEDRELIQPYLTSEYAFKLSYTVSLLILYALFFKALGYIATTFLFMFALFLGTFKRKWIRALLWSLATVTSTYLVFEIWLQSRFPSGIFPWWH